MTLTPTVLVNCRNYLAGADLTAFENKLELSASVTDEEVTTFNSGGWKERVGGLKEFGCNADFFWQAADNSMPDDTFWGQLGTATVPFTAIPATGAVGDLAYVSRVLDAEYKQGAPIGKVLSGSAQLKGNWPLGRGLVLHPNGTARTSTANGTAVLVGATLATQALYVTLHVFSVSGTSSPTITVAIQSDDNSGFTSAATVGTFTAATAIGGQTMRVAGAITDTYLRASWTISGTNPSFLFAVAAAVAPL